MQHDFLIASDSCFMTCEGIALPEGVRATCSRSKFQNQLQTMTVSGVSELANDGTYDMLQIRFTP